MKSKFFLPGVIAAALISGWIIFMYTLLPAGPPSHWDETAHAVTGLLIAYDLQQGDWLNFMFDTYRQVYWPPLHSWFTGIAYIVAGTSMIAARFVSLTAFMLAALILYLAAGQIQQRQPQLAGIITVVLFLTSPPLSGYAAMAMLEIPAIFTQILTFLIYFRLNRGDCSPSRYMLLGLGISLTYFTKTNYGILLGMVIVFNELIEVKFRLQDLFTRNTFYTVLPMAIIFGIWFAYPPKLVSTWKHMVNQPWGVSDPYSIDGLLFYPLTFYRMSGSGFIFTLLLVALISAFKSRKNKNIRFLIVFVLTLLLIGQLHHTKLDRHLYPILPALFLLSGHTIAAGWFRFCQDGLMIRRLLFYGFAGALFLHAIFLFYSNLHLPPTDDSQDVINYIDIKARKPGSTLIIGTMELMRPNIPGIDWQLITQKHLIRPPQVAIFTAAAETQKLEALLNRLNAPGWLVELMHPVLVRGRWSEKVNILYIGNYPFEFRRQKELDAFLASRLPGSGIEKIVVITSLSERARQPIGFIAPGLEKTGMRRVSSREFNRLGTRVDEFQKTGEIL